MCLIKGLMTMNTNTKKFAIGTGINCSRSGFAPFCRDEEVHGFLLECQRSQDIFGSNAGTHGSNSWHSQAALDRTGRKHGRYQFPARRQGFTWNYHPCGILRNFARRVQAGTDRGGRGNRDTQEIHQCRPHLEEVCLEIHQQDYQARRSIMIALARTSVILVLARAVYGTITGEST